MLKNYRIKTLNFILSLSALINLTEEEKDEQNGGLHLVGEKEPFRFPTQFPEQSEREKSALSHNCSQL